jgi:hypothetical protein
MRLTLRILSTLLRYPDAKECSRSRPCYSMLCRAMAILTPRQRETLRPLVDQLIADDLLDLQERYVALFDRGRALSLHLFEHVHGESRDRGQAMVDLRDRYEAQGLEISRGNCRIICRCSSNICPPCPPIRPWRNWPSQASSSVRSANGWTRKTRPMPRRCGCWPIWPARSESSFRSHRRRSRRSRRSRCPVGGRAGPFRSARSSRHGGRMPTGIRDGGAVSIPRTRQEFPPWLIISIICFSAYIPMSRWPCWRWVPSSAMIANPIAGAPDRASCCAADSS